jgi:catechol 2,3-dioxygenase-like lactoylglutathione lyase family enzyme
MAAVVGPDFIALQVRDLRRSRAFYTEQLGLRPAKSSPPGAVVFDTRPVPFAIREPLVSLDASPKLGWGVSLWLAVDDAQGLHDKLVTAGTPVPQPLSPGAFGPQFSFVDPDGYLITVHQPAR